MIEIKSTTNTGYELENGVILTLDNWTDNYYKVGQTKYFPVFKTNKQNHFDLDVIGFENTSLKAQQQSDTTFHLG